jgi:cyclophilin family peptidyl-prolyl cis-trans isomerase
MTTTATLHTSLGDIVIELFPNHAPKDSCKLC